MKYLLVLLSLGFLLSCSSDDGSGNSGDDGQGNIQSTLLLKKVLKDGVILREYEYFTDNKLKSQVGLLVDDQIVELLYEYVADTIVESYYYINETIPFLINKSYEINNTTSRKDVYSHTSDFNLAQYTVYTFNNNPCGASMKEYYNSSGSLLSYIVFSYTDENCSTDSVNEGFGYNNDSSLNDTKKASFESINSPIEKQEILHNVLEHSVWDDNDQLMLNQSYNSEFEYNSDDYPTKETRTYLDGTLLVLMFEYY